VRLHPTCGHPTREPDFEVQNAQTKPLAIVEVTTFNPAADEVAQGQRDAAVYNALDKAKLPAWWRIGLDTVKHGEKPASLSKICNAVETWAAGVAGDDPLAMPTKTFDADDWSIEITLYGGFDKDIPADRMIATSMGDVRIIKPHEEIRQAVQFKGSRYGAMISAQQRNMDDRLRSAPSPAAQAPVHRSVRWGSFRARNDPERPC
jgi:hypothetical protein